MPIRRKLNNLDASYKVSTGNKITRTITDFLNTEYREYSNYVISTRALPSLWDGMKVGGRKILYSAFVGGLKDGSEKKLLNLIGDVYNKTLYAHGDASLIGASLTLGSYYSDNLNPIEIVGQGGSLRNSQAAAARYLYCKLSKYAKLLYKVDEDLLQYVFDEGEYLEPEHFLPIIPLVLTARTEGLAPGYKFSSFSYNPIDIIDGCTEVIKNGHLEKTIIRPYVRGIKQDKFGFDKDSNKWYNVGEWSIDEKNDILRITDLPYDVQFDKFEKKLNSYIENGYIKEWKNFSHDNDLDYRILFDKSKLAREAQPDKKEQLLKKFMLQTNIPNDLLYVLDENKKVKHFQTKEDLLEHFVKIRLEKYNDRKDRLVSVKEKQLEENSNLCKFIELVTSGKLVLNNRKMADVKKDLDAHKLPYNVLTIQVSKLTQEEKEEILKKNKEIEQELEYIKNTTIEQMYLDDLKNLKKELIKDFE